MVLLHALITACVVFSVFLLLRPLKNRRPGKIIAVIHFTFLGLIIFSIYFLYPDLSFIGQYTKAIIGLAFLISGILLFGATASKAVRVYSGFIAIPAFLTQLALLIGRDLLVFPGSIVYLVFAPPLKREKIDDRYSLEIRRGGMIAPPNLFYLAKRKNFLFERKIPLSTPEYLSPISKIEIVGFKENEWVVCRIYNAEAGGHFSSDTLYYEKR